MRLVKETRNSGFDGGRRGEGDGRRLASDSLTLGERGPPDSREAVIVRLLACEFMRCLQRTDNPSLPGIVHTQSGRSEVLARQLFVSFHGGEVKVIQLKSRYLEVLIWCKWGSYSVCKLNEVPRPKQAIAALSTTPETPERINREFNLEFVLWQALAYTRGFATEETIRAARRMREVGEKIGNPEQLISALRAAWLSADGQGEWTAAQQIAEQMLVSAIM